MNISRETVKSIYDKLGDELSREVFKNRLMYSLTGDHKWIYENLKTNQEGKAFIHKLDHCAAEGKEFVVFGAGLYGKTLYKVFRGYPWKCFVDNYPKADSCEGLPLFKTTEFINMYDGEYIFIFTKKYCNEIYKQLCDAGIPQEKLINIYELADGLSRKEYFDLEYISPDENKEVFVDCGCFDGTTSLRFFEWCGGNGHVYAFEPDEANYRRCKENFEKNHLSYTLIPKGVWKEEDILHFNGNAQMASFISENGESKVDVTALDVALQDAGVTFIKMDVEGSEFNALTGATNIIKNDKPKLAICIYHKDEDVIELPELILKLNPEYKLYMRHYSLVEFETVVYAV